MPIKRFYATADTTITNAYREDLSTRGDDSNMGQADTLEIFSLFDQVETARTSVDGSSTIVPEREMARILIKFDTADIIADSTTSFTGNPYTASNSKFILRMSNAVHGKTLPDNFTVDVFALDTAFDEGYGIDADEYRDSGAIGQSAAASWNSAAYDAAPLATPSTGSFHVDVNPLGNFTIEVGGHDLTVAPNVGGAAATGDDIATALGAAPYNVLVAASSNNLGEVTLTSLDIGGNFITLSATLDIGDTGIILVNSDDWVNVGSGGTSGVNHLEGGVDTVTWTTEGGDFGTNTPTPIASQTFVEGDEDLEIDITSYVLAIASDTDGLGGYPDLGLLIKMSATEEALLRSFYTKKFFARSSEYFFLRPCIEVRQSPGASDDRSNFYAVHTMRTDNNNNLLLENYENGALVAAANAPDSLNIWVDSTKNVLLANQGVAAAAGLTGTYETGDFTLDTELEEVYLEWLDGVNILHTEVLQVKQREIRTALTTPKYVLSMPNLKPSYLGKDPNDLGAVAEIARLRLFVRLKDWSPNIYSKATKQLQPEIMTEAYYKIIRMADDFVVADYGVGTNLLNDDHTKLRYGADGNFFDLDMSLLERGFAYGLKFMFVFNGERREQEEVFKFRVE